MTGSDLESGTWTSQIWDASTTDPPQISSFETSASIGTGENAYVRLGADTDDDGAVEQWSHGENSGVSLSDGLNILGSSDFNLDSAYRYQAEYYLESPDTTSSPSIENYELTVQEAGNFYISDVSVDNSVIDRKMDLSWSDPQLSTQVSVEATNNTSGENASDIKDNAIIDIEDASGNPVVSGQSAVSTEIVSENVKRFTFPVYDPSDSLADGDLGGFDTFAEVWTSDDYDNSSSADIFHVYDYDNSVLPSQENLSGHRQRIYGTASLLGGATAALDNAKRIDSNVDNAWGSVSGADFENTYKPGDNGTVYFELVGESGAVDGRTDNLSYQFPNLPPEIHDYSVSETLIDRDQDFEGSEAVLETDISVQIRDPDNYSDLVNSRISVRDANGTMMENADAWGSQTVVNENILEFSLTYDPPDSSDNLGDWDVHFRSEDNYGASVNSWKTALFTVDDITSSFSYSPSNPYVGWPFTVSGTASAIHGSVTLDNAWLIDNEHGTFNLGSGNSWSAEYEVKNVAIGESVGVRAQLKDPPLDGLASDSYTTSSSQKFQVETRYENTGNLIDNLELHDFEVKFWYDLDDVKNTTRMPISSAKENFVVDCGGEEVFLVRVYDGDAYWRSRVPESQGGELPFLIPGPGENIAQYTFQLKDYTQEFSDGYIRFYTGQGIVNEDWWDAASTSYAYLIYHRYYSVRLFSRDGDETMEIRHFQAESDLTPEPFVAAMYEGDNKINFRYDVISDYAWRDNDGDVMAQWSSADDNTEMLTIRVYDSARENLLTEYQVAHPTDILFEWNEASENESYWVEIKTEHKVYGTFSDWFSISEDVEPVPSPEPVPHGGFPIPLATIGGTFLAAIVAMLWTRDQPGNAMLGTAVMVSFLSLMGTYLNVRLMPIGWAVTVFLWIMAILWKFSEGM